MCDVIFLPINRPVVEYPITYQRSCYEEVVCRKSRSLQVFILAVTLSSGMTCRKSLSLNLGTRRRWASESFVMVLYIIFLHEDHKCSLVCRNDKMRKVIQMVYRVYHTEELKCFDR